MTKKLFPAGARAFSYLRFSRPEQADGDSIRRQLTGSERFAEQHGLPLDTSLRDEGLSGYSNRRDAKGQLSDRYALAGFLAAAKAGKVPPGSVLIVENLDRLSREEIRPALSLFLQILDLQVTIVQLEPLTIFRHEATDPFDLMRAIMELARGNSESRMRSARLGEVWQEKKRNAAEKKLTAKVPGWLRLVNGKIEKIPDAVATVQAIYRWAIDGDGIGTIVKRLNAGPYRPIGKTKRSDKWAKSSVTKILSTRTVLGEYQPHTRRGGQRRPVGDPIPGYYPAIIDEPTFYAARQAAKARRTDTTPAKAKGINLFTGLLRDARDKGTIILVNKGSHPQLVSYKATIGKGTYIAFPYEAFERAILRTFIEINPCDLTPNKGVDKVGSLSGQLDDLDARLAKIEAQLEEGGDVDTLAKVAKRLEAKQKEVRQQLDAARQEATGRQGECLKELQSLVGRTDADERTVLKAKIRQLVKEIWAVFDRDGTTQTARIQLHFRSGAKRTLAVTFRHEVRGTAQSPERFHLSLFDEGVPVGDLKELVA